MALFRRSDGAASPLREPGHDASPGAVDVYKAMLRDRIGPVVRAAGFTGTAPTWVLANPQGDRAVVNVQSSDSSNRDEVRFTVNLAVVPLPWWRWINHKHGTNESRAVKEYDGLWRDRLRANQQQATSRPDWWSVSDASSADKAAADVITQLQTQGLARLRQLLEPGRMLAEARTSQVGLPKHDTRGAVAVLLTENGRSAELDALLSELETVEDARLRSIFWPMARWCRTTVV